jgi:hypothetical protein
MRTQINTKELKEKVKKLKLECIKEEKDFQDYLKTEVDSSIVLKTHLYIEHQLNEIIKLNFPRPSKLIKKYFLDKIDLLYSMHYFPPTSDLYEKLKVLNSIRNDFGHNYKCQIDAEKLSIFSPRGNKKY